ILAAALAAFALVQGWRLRRAAARGFAILKPNGDLVAGEPRIERTTPTAGDHRRSPDIVPLPPEVPVGDGGGVIEVLARNYPAARVLPPATGLRNPVNGWVIVGAIAAVISAVTGVVGIVQHTKTKIVTVSITTAHVNTTSTSTTSTSTST